MYAFETAIAVIVFIVLIVHLWNVSQNNRAVKEIYQQFYPMHNEAYRAGMNPVDLAVLMAHAATLRNQKDAEGLRHLKNDFYNLILSLGGDPR